MHYSIRFPATLEKANDAYNTVSEWLKKENCSQRTLTQVGIALDEIVSNIVYYAYGPEGGEIEITLDVDPDSFEFHVIDEGVAFNPLTAKEPDVTLPAEERKIGGYGIFIVQTIMDDVRYRRDAIKNILSFKKKR